MNPTPRWHSSFSLRSLEDTFVLEPGFPGRGSVTGLTQGPSARPQWTAPAPAPGLPRPPSAPRASVCRSPSLGGFGSGQAGKRRRNLGWDAALGGSGFLPPGPTAQGGGVRRGFSRLEREGVAVSLTWAPVPGKGRPKSRGPLPTRRPPVLGPRRGGPVPSPFALAPARSALGHQLPSPQPDVASKAQPWR